MQCLEDYISHKCSISLLRKFCQYVMSREVLAGLTDRISVRCLLMPIPGNGYLAVKRKNGIYKYRLHINLFPFITGQYTSNRMKLFYLYATIAHELKHIELLEKEQADDYAELLAFWEEYRNFSRLRLLDGIGMILMRKNALKSSRNRYRVSLAEILCNLSSFQRSYVVFRPLLAEAETNVIESMIDSLAFLKKNICITYSHRNQPYHLYTKMVREVQAVLKKEPRKVDEMKPMRCLFHSNSHVKSIEQLYEERTAENESTIDGLLINWFVCADMDFSLIFQNRPEIKKHIEMLANAYCRNAVEYLTNHTVGSIFLDLEILQDNVAMLVKNADRLNKLMLRYNMMHCEGTVIPLYSTGRK